MDAVIYTKSIPEYEMLSGILADELSDVTVSRGVIDREYHLEREYDVVVVGINGAQGMELVCKYRELYGNTLVIWITDDPYFAREAIRTHSFDFIVRPLEETRFREPLRRIKEGDIAIWQRWSVKARFIRISVKEMFRNGGKFLCPRRGRSIFPSEKQGGMERYGKG